MSFAAGAPAVVDRVSFEVAAGETLCLVGESGCGKSLTALAVMGLVPMPPGRVGAARLAFENEDLLAMDRNRRTELRGGAMAMIFQEPMTSLNPVFPIGEQIAESVRRHQGLGRRQARDRALAMLEKVRIPAAAARLDAYPHQLSGGMRQRVMIAIALANDPRLLLADEPTTALDVTIQAQILELVATLQKETGTGLLLITHDLGVVAEIADRVAVMYAGRIVETGPTAALFDDPQHPYTLGLLSSMPSLGARSDRLATVPGTVPPIEAMPEGCRFRDRCPFALPDCSLEPPLSPVGGEHRVACWRAPLEAMVGGQSGGR